MTKRFCILFTVIFTGLIFFSVGTLIAAQTVPDMVTIENKDYKKDKKRPVPFSHKMHSTDKKYGPVACADCHHVYKDGKNVWTGDAKKFDNVDKCSKCHDPKKNTKDGGVKVMKLQNAYHKNCKNCHKAEKKGPFKKCNECHVKK
jgi:class III cytochrome C family protein